MGDVIHLAVRAWSDGTLLFDEKVDVTDDQNLELLVERHMKQLVDHPKHMLEIEFLDEPDVNQRFFRFGTDPRGMVIPIGIRLG